MITDAQFAAATERLGIGSFLRAAPIATGLFGQNVFVTTNQGDFVLRGAPHYVSANPRSSAPPYVQNDLWQFTKEVFFAKVLHERTGAPVPWPQLLDESTDIFGWPYIIMPRMGGTCLDERSIKALSGDTQLAIAGALGRGTIVMQELSWSFAGDFDPTINLTAYPSGHAAHLVSETQSFAASARGNGRLAPEDDSWLDSIFAGALALAPARRPNVYVHGDYKLNNLALSGSGADWCVSGVFDLHESRFGDGASEVCRQASSYLDTAGPELAREFIRAYRSQTAPDPTIGERMPLYVVNDRIKFWEYFTRPEINAQFFRGKTFRDYAEHYIEAIDALL